MRTPQLADNLRRAVLQAAIEGKLNDRTNENARDLLAAIQTEKAALQKTGKLKKDKPLAAISEEEIPFAIPENWVWVRLEDYLQFVDYRGMTPLKIEKGVRLITAANIKKGFFDHSTEAYISEDEYQQRMSRGITELGDVIFTTEAPLGHCCLNPFEKSSCGQRIITFKPYVKADYINQFIVYVINSTFFQKEINDNKSGVTAKGIKAATLKTFLFPLPPLTEQQQIVAKLNRLLAEIDNLKTQEQALLAAQNAFPKKLRAAILQAAIQGELNERTNENARDLLAAIQAEKTALQKTGKLKKDKPLAAISEEEIPFAIPDNWVWVRLGDVILQNIGGGTPSKQEPSYWNGEIPWASVKDLNCDVLTKTIDSITAEGLENSSANLIPKGTFIICTRMGLGKIALAEIDVAINQDLRAVFLSKSINKKYFYHFYRTLKMEGKGATVKGITVEELHNIPIPLPPLTEQQQIVAKLEALLAEIDTLENAA
jgi:type i restriction modification DNA specificity domain